MNYGELKAAIAAYAHREDLSDQIPTFVSLATERLNRDLRIPSMVSDITCTPDANPYELPADFLDLRELSGSTPNGGRYLLQSVGRHQLATYQNTGNAVPQFYALTGNKIEVAPATGNELRLVYWASVDLPATDDATNVIMDEWSTVYLWGSLVELHRYTQDSQEQQKAEMNYISDLTRLNEEAESTRFGEAPTSQGASSWV